MKIVAFIVFALLLTIRSSKLSSKDKSVSKSNLVFLKLEGVIVGETFNLPGTRTSPALSYGLGNTAEYVEPQGVRIIKLIRRASLNLKW